MIDNSNTVVIHSSHIIVSLYSLICLKQLHITGRSAQAFYPFIYLKDIKPQDPAYLTAGHHAAPAPFVESLYGEPRVYRCLVYCEIPFLHVYTLRERIFVPLAPFLFGLFEPTAFSSPAPFAEGQGAGEGRSSGKRSLLATTQFPGVSGVEGSKWEVLIANRRGSGKEAYAEQGGPCGRRGAVLPKVKAEFPSCVFEHTALSHAQNAVGEWVLKR